MKQIAVKISNEAHDRLQRLAHQAKTNYATIIEAALSVYEPGASENASHSASEIHLLIESAMEPVLERLEMLESLGLVKHPHPSSITVEIAQNAPEIAVAASGIPEVGSAEKGAEIGLESAIEALPGAMENEAGDSLSILSEKEPHHGKKPVKAFIADLVQSGIRSPAKIARALNEAGYRTQAGSEFQRSNPQIASALRGVKA